jgi:glycosyltransferase involved in cell wall biosynthesis
MLSGVIKELWPTAALAGSTRYVGDALCGLDCLMLVTPAEGMSLSIIEAWLAGVPVVATRVGAIPELQRDHGRLAVTVSVDADPAELADAVRQALSKDNRETVERARQIAQKHYTVKAMAERWFAFLRTFAGRTVDH